MTPSDQAAVEQLRREFPEWTVDAVPELGFIAVSHPYQNAEHFLHAASVAELRVKLQAAG